MDLSALIFVALAVAWAVYLIPKALTHHEDSAASRSIEGFSDRLRVLARREPVDSTTARLVVRGARVESDAVPEPVPAPGATTRPDQARRAAAARAARRRLRVVGVILVGITVVGVLAATSIVPAASTLIPVTVLVAWLAACRLMVRSERAAHAAVPRRPAVVDPGALPFADDDPATEEIAVVRVEADPAAASVQAEPAAADESRARGWDPVPVTLPTYVGKEPAARRTVRTIDLDSTGVWTSGPLAADSEIAREADEA
ncbi:MAG: hypothetical protein WB471_02220, partial [Nocardioides sp.]